MKRIILSFATIVVVTIACILLNDGWVYLMATLMALPVIHIIFGNKRWVMKVTRWSKANTLKTQVLIAVMQLALFSLAILAGYNFKQLGYEFSNSTPIVFISVIILGFLSVPFLPKRKIIVIPKEVNKQRLAFLGIALSSFVLLVVCGNRMEELYPNSLITSTVRQIDAAIFPAENPGDKFSTSANPENSDQAFTGQTPESAVFASFSSKEKRSASEKKVSKLEKKQLKMMKRLQKKYRLAYAGGISFGAVLLIVLLVFTSCVGICMMALSGGAIGYIALGAAILVGSIFGIAGLINAGRRNN